MNAQVSFHPDKDILAQFVGGELTTGYSVIVSAHVQMCETCSEKAKELQTVAASAWTAAAPESQNSAPTAASISALAAEIVKTPQVTEEPETNLVDVKLDVLDHGIAVPRVIANAVAEGIKWQKAPGGIQEANLYLDDSTQCEFIYISPGSKTPVHTHLGGEMTLILDGSFHDHMGKYQFADFTYRDQQHKHQPISDEGCLCFAVIDRPLKFTEGISRLMNPYNRYKFKKGVFKPS